MIYALGIVVKARTNVITTELCIHTHPFPLTGGRTFQAPLPGAGEVPGLGSTWFSGCGFSGRAALPHGA